MITLILYFVVLPVVWVAVGGACTGFVVASTTEYIDPATRVWMVVLAPLTLIVLAGALAYRMAHRTVEYFQGVE
jgi:hypothetical protein